MARGNRREAIFRDDDDRDFFLNTLAESGLGAFGMADTAEGRRRFAQRPDRRGVEEGLERAGVPELDAAANARCSHLRRGWHWGSQAVAERVLQLAEKTLKKTRHRSANAGGEKRAHEVREAERLVCEGLAAAGPNADDLARLKGSDARKIAIARVIRESEHGEHGLACRKAGVEKRGQCESAIAALGKSLAPPPCGTARLDVNLETLRKCRLTRMPLG